MQIRIFSRAGLAASLSLSAAFVGMNNEARSQDASGLYTNPDTGLVYRQVTRTIERPVSETHMTTQERTVYRPQTVTEARPEARTVYTPVVEYQWEPRLHGRWNPFRQPAVAYHHVPVARWEARSEVVSRVNTRTEWVAEKQTLEVPQRFTRIEREQKTDFEVVGRVAPPNASGTSDQIASRLRPLDSQTRIEPLVTSGPVLLASEPSRRNVGQGGLRATELHSNSGVYGQVLPPVSSGIGIATLPAPPLWR